MKIKSLIFLTIIIFTTTNGCAQDENKIDYKQEMRNFVQEISEYARNQRPDFIVIPQNGVQLVSNNGKWNGKPDLDYLNAIDGLGQESLYFGSTEDDINTPLDLSDYLEFYLDIGKDAGKTILVTDYTSTPTRMDSSYDLNEEKEYISFAADDRNLTTIPDYPEVIKDENTDPVSKLSDAENFLYLLNPEGFSSKMEFLTSISETNYGVVIMDAFYFDTLLTPQDLNLLKKKADGGDRLLISYMSIGEAEDYRYYWNESWEPGNPDWIVAENPNWEGNFKVKYWELDWKSYIYGNTESYLQKIIDAGFDGVYLDIIDGFYYFEQLAD
ncbi:MAG: endo alpha-1,4 polygalactosaminidase [Balneolaceae bacterium]